jgi:triacylglycerol lipase
MLVWISRLFLVLTLFIAALLGHLAREAWGFGAGFLVLIVSLALLQTCFALVALALSAPEFLTQAPLTRRLSASALEVFAFWRIFATLTPFEDFWMGRESTLPYAPDNVPVVLIPGYCCNRAMWFDLARDLSAAGRLVAPVNLEPPFADIDRLGQELGQHIARIREQTGAEKVLLVGHSMGGLAARAWLAQHGGEGVAGLITLATPHHGSRHAKLAFGRNARQMEWNSEWLGTLNTRTPPVPVHAFWAGRDEFDAPPHSACLSGAAETGLPLSGHYSLLWRREPRAAILRASAPPAVARAI